MKRLEKILYERKRQRYSWGDIADLLPIGQAGIRQAFTRGKVDEMYLEIIEKELGIVNYKQIEQNVLKEPSTDRIQKILLEKKKQGITWKDLAKELPIEQAGLRNAFERGNVKENYLSIIEDKLCIKYESLNDTEHTESAVKMELGDRIKKVRTYNGDTQKQLSDTIGVNLRTLQNYEYNEAEAPISILKAIAKHYNISTSYFINETPTPLTDGDELKYTSADALNRILDIITRTEKKIERDHNAFAMAHSSAVSNTQSILVKLEDVNSKTEKIITQVGDYDDNVNNLINLLHGSKRGG